MEPQELVDFFNNFEDLPQALDEWKPELLARGWTEEQITTAYNNAVATKTTSSGDVQISNTTVNTSKKYYITGVAVVLFLTAIAIYFVSVDNNPDTTIINTPEDASISKEDLTLIETPETIDSNYLAPIAAQPIIPDNGPRSGEELVYYDTDFIPGITVSSVMQKGEDIIVSGSGFLKLNRETILEGDTCVIKNDTKYSIGENTITMQGYGKCLPNQEQNYLAISRYMHELEGDELASYTTIYNNLGGEGLPKVIMRNKFKIIVESGTTTIDTPPKIAENLSEEDYISGVLDNKQEILNELELNSVPPIDDSYDDWAQLAVFRNQGDDTKVACMKEPLLSIKEFATQQELDALSLEMLSVVSSGIVMTDTLEQLGETYPEWNAEIQDSYKQCIN